MANRDYKKALGMLPRGIVGPELWYRLSLSGIRAKKSDEEFYRSADWALNHSRALDGLYNTLLEKEIFRRLDLDGWTESVKE